MNVNLNVNTVYKPYLGSYKNRTEVYYGGAGSGKSVFVAQKMIIKALRGKRKILVVRKVKASLKDSCVTLILSILDSLGLKNIYKYNKTTHDIELPNGSMFLFKGMDNTEKVKSIADITDIWIEEATELTLDDYTQLDLRTRADVPNSQIILSFNPISKANWCYITFFADKSKIDAFILHTTYKDNKFLPQSYITSLQKMKKYNYAYYKIYALGEFATLNKLVYQNVKVLDFDVSELIKSKVYKTITGLDFGFTNDTTAFIASLADKDNKKLYIFQEYGDTGLLNSDIAKAITTLGYAKTDIVADSAEEKSIAELKKLGLRKIVACEKGPDSILHGIQKLQQYEIYVHPSCVNVITEFENYAWQKDKNTNEYINKPIDKFNHYMDALRYSIQLVDKRKGVGTLDKRLFGI